MVEDFDVTEITDLLVQRCVELLDVDMAGIMLSDGKGELHVLSSTSEATHRIEALQLRVGSGPCVTAFPDRGRSVCRPRGRRLTMAGRLRGGADGRIPFVLALPMKTRKEMIGALNLFKTTSEP